MSLKIYDCDQGTDEWHTLRRGVVTASTIGALITPKRLQVSYGKTAQTKIMELVAERITDYTEDFAWSKDMERGTLDEPYARDAYAEHNNTKVLEVGFMTREVDDHIIGYSPDGLVGADGLIEIKSRRQRIQLDTILNNEVPEANMAQLQTALFVSGRKWIDFVSYSGGMPLYTKRVTPDPAWQNIIPKALAEAEALIEHQLDKYYKAVEGLPMTERIDHFEEVELKL